MRGALGFVVLVAMATGLHAQQRGGAPGVTFRHGPASSQPFGTWPAGMPNPFYPGATTHAQRLSASISGYPGYMLGPQPHGKPYGGGIYPIGVPMYWGGYGYAAPSPNFTILNVSPPPAVIINYEPERARPVVREYREPSEFEPRTYQAPIPSHPEPPASEGSIRLKEDKPAIYLIALKDGTVYSAYAYWVEGDTLHYVTTARRQSKAGLTAVDYEVTAALNRERNVEVRLPRREAKAR